MLGYSEEWKIYTQFYERGRKYSICVQLSKLLPIFNKLILNRNQFTREQHFLFTALVWSNYTKRCNLELKLTFFSSGSRQVSSLSYCILLAGTHTVGRLQHHSHYCWLHTLQSIDLIITVRPNGHGITQCCISNTDDLSAQRTNITIRAERQMVFLEFLMWVGKKICLCRRKKSC